MQISTRLATDEAQYFLLCTQTFDKLHNVIDKVELLKRKNYKDIIELYESLNIVFLDYNNFSHDVIKKICDKYEDQVADELKAIRKCSMKFKKFSFFPVSQNIMTHLVRSCEITDKLFIIKLLHNQDSCREFDDIKYKYAGIFFYMTKGLRDIANLL
jgi:hypothetical protein